ncbi:hypothetical protein AYI70_g5819 [Smittium culicis]|uniref:Uncharacterized protein n=1 Tax=Smittium culicis TaxID=133412 RepID=A0A1R1XSS6_9FUNG|nr:hypothetical protein AYI70_g5819 [Smittium culicis]
MINLSKFALLAISFADANKINEFGKNFSELSKYSGGQELSNSINQKNLILKDSDNIFEYSRENYLGSVHDKTDANNLGLINDKKLLDSKNLDSNEDISAANDSEKNEINQLEPSSKASDIKKIGNRGGCASIEDIIKIINYQNSDSYDSSDPQKAVKVEVDKRCDIEDGNKMMLFSKKFTRVPMIRRYNANHGIRGNFPNYGFGMNRHRRGPGPRVNRNRRGPGPRVNRNRRGHGPRVNRHRRGHGPRVNRHRRGHGPRLNRHRRGYGPRANRHRRGHGPRVNRHRRGHRPRVNRHRRGHGFRKNRPRRGYGRKKNLLKKRYRKNKYPNRKPKYMASDAGIVRKIEHMLRRIPNGGDYNSHGSSRCYPSGHFAPLRFRDIEGPLKQLSNAGKTGNTGSMAVAIRSGMGGLQKGPNRVAEFFTVFNDGMRKYAGHMKKQMVKGSREIRNIYVLRRKMAIYVRSFYGNEHQLADFIKLLFMHFNCSQAAKSNFAQTLSMMIEYSNSARVRNVSYGYRPLQSSIRRFTDMLNTHYTCQSNRIFDGNGRHIGEVIDSAISGDSGAIYEFVEIIVRSANKNIRLFRNDVLTLIYTSQTYMNLFSTSLYNVFSAITGDPTHLANVIDSTTRGFIRHKRTVRYLLYFYKSYYRLKHVYIGDIIMRFVSSFFVVLCIFWIPFCCCC